MTESSPANLRPNDDPDHDRLDSWKEIAAYLGREVRTVQGWEKGEGLPIHRHLHARQGSVYAFRSELNAWRESRRETTIAAASPEPAQPMGSATRSRALAWLTGVAVLASVALGFILLRRATVPAVSPPLSSVAVLPFLDLSPEKDQDFSDGLTEEIIDALSRVPGLHVAARTSAFAFKGKPIDIRLIGQQLNVAAVLEGSVRKSGGSLRITAQLNRVSDGFHLWSQTYDRELQDIFTVQRELSQSIASQLQAGTVPAYAATNNLDAYHLNQEGHYFFNQHQVPTSYRKAIDRYQRAIQLDPTYAAAHAGLADAYAYLAEQFAVAPREVMPKAKEAAEKAVALDDSSADAHTSLGLVKLDYERDIDGAQREFQRAIQLNPSSGYIRHWYAHSLEAQNRLSDAMREMRAAQSLDPLLPVLSWDIANELLAAHQPDEALRHLMKVDELFPNMPLTAYFRVEAHHQKGDLGSARAVLNQLAASEPGAVNEPIFIALFGVADAREGRRERALHALERLEQLRRSQYVDPALVIELCSVLEDRDRLLLWIRRAHDERSTLFVYLPLRRELYADDPNAIALVEARAERDNGRAGR